MASRAAYTKACFENSGKFGLMSLWPNFLGMFECFPFGFSSLFQHACGTLEKLDHLDDWLFCSDKTRNFRFNVNMAENFGEKGNH